ncbi:hypothetical protein JAAARDRAFT_42264 [Jaapia argillacea MUCL 33604]|uniref:Uncharacterized protein n=1 Tax=Jaapia argillacea MUCL 33604 TaxID=933084 RepID=A0A067PIH1_9AGAM|nr:hypothetical protein JAAARDRAFT_42264 [Jaapia argillacea MUCL 33604]
MILGDTWHHPSNLTLSSPTPSRQIILHTAILLTGAHTSPASNLPTAAFTTYLPTTRHVHLTVLTTSFQTNGLRREGEDGDL